MKDERDIEIVLESLKIRPDEKVKEAAFWRMMMRHADIIKRRNNTMSETENVNKVNQKEMSPDELANVHGGASDYSGVCGRQLGQDCLFCTQRKDGQFIFDGVWHDTVGCSLSLAPLGSIDGRVLVNGNPIPLPPEA